ncbi:MAG: PEGA domain-containing protein [Planctomycetes bacterium]|nr:PEGA domain-containing protein [Planctomycetota bacterium]
MFEGGASADFQDRDREAPSFGKSNAPTTRIYVRTTPPDAKVLLDGQPIGISNGLFFAPTGDHKISLEMSSHDPHSREVKILQGQITRIEVQLKRSS